jgi:hypothetical protein
MLCNSTFDFTGFLGNNNFSCDNSSMAGYLSNMFGMENKNGLNLTPVTTLTLNVPSTHGLSGPLPPQDTIPGYYQAGHQ